MYPRFQAAGNEEDLPAPPRHWALRCVGPANEFAVRSFHNQLAFRKISKHLMARSLYYAERMYPRMMINTYRGRYPTAEIPYMHSRQRPVEQRDLGYLLKIGPYPNRPLELDFLKVEHGNDPKPYPHPQRKRIVNPYKQPSVYSTLPTLCNEQHAKSNSTSSIFFVPSSKPPVYELIVGTAFLVFTQIISDEGELLPQIQPSFNTPPHLQQALALFDESRYLPHGQHPEKVTSLSQVEQFIKHIFDTGQFQTETVLITMIFFNRFISRTGIRLHYGNWKPVYMMAVILSQKVCDDTPLINKDFGIIYPPFKLHIINKLELVMLDLLEFDLFVDRSSFNFLLLQMRYASRHGFHRRVTLREQAQKYVVVAHGHADVDHDFEQYIEQHHFAPNQAELDALKNKRPFLPPIHEGVTPIQNRHAQKRVHFTDVYSVRRSHWKRRVMTAEMLELPDRYRILQ